MSSLNTPRGEPTVFGFDRLPVDADDAPPPAPFGISDATTLKDLLSEWRFFTHAILMECMRLPIDPVQNWVNLEDGVDQISVYTDSIPIFEGLSPKFGLENRLFACRKEKWKSLRQLMSGLCGVDRARGLFYRSFYYHIQLADFLRLRQVTMMPDPVPTVPVTVFGASSAKHVYYLKEQLEAWRPPRVTFLDASPADAALGRAVLAEDVTQLNSKLFQVKQPKMVFNAQTEFFEFIAEPEPEDTLDE